MIYIAPDPFSSVFKPLENDGYPYDKMTGNGIDLDIKPAGYKGPWTNETFPFPYIPYKDLVENVAKSQRDPIEANPEKFIIFRQYGGGAAAQEHPQFKNAATHLLQWLSDLEMPEESKGTLDMHITAYERRPKSAF